MFYTCNYNIRVTHRNGAIKHILHESDPRRDHQQIVLYSFWSLHALALHLAVKDISKSSVWRFEHVGLTYICRLYFPPECQQDRTLLRKLILLSENIPNIWHKSSTKHKEVRPDWNDKNDNANYAPSYHMEGFTNIVAILNNTWSSAKRFRLWIVLFRTKTSQRLTLYLLSSHR